MRSAVAIVAMAAADRAGLWRGQIVEASPEALAQRALDEIERSQGALERTRASIILGGESAETACAISRRFELGGTACAIDAGEASALAALSVALDELALGRSDLVLVGDSRALFALKPLDAAERDRNPVYALVRAVASGSDSRPTGRFEVVSRAAEQSGLETARLGLIEAEHSDVEALAGLFGPEAVAVCAVGTTAYPSVSLFKLALALRHRVVPVSADIGCELPRALYRNLAARPWLGDPPRWAAVGASSDGGALFHAVLEEYVGENPAPRLRALPCELFLLSAGDRSQLAARCRAGELSCEGGEARLALVCERSRLGELLALAAERLESDEASSWSEPGMRFALGSESGKVAVLFPAGAETALELAVELESVRAAGEGALATLSALETAGVHPDFLAGHGCGELTALHAAGALDRSTFKELSRRRTELIESTAPGGLIAVDTTADEIEKLLVSWKLPLTVAYYNAPRQIVLSGPEAQLTKLKRRLKKQGLEHRVLPARAAYHSQQVSSAWEIFDEMLQQASVQAPSVRVYSNSDAAAYPTDPALVRQRLAEHLVSPVRFSEMVEALYEEGVRTFVELGPGATLSPLIDPCLEGRAAHVLSVEANLHSLWNALGALFVAGLEVDPQRLLADRGPAEEPLKLSPAPPRRRAPASAGAAVASMWASLHDAYASFLSSQADAHKLWMAQMQERFSSTPPPAPAPVEALEPPAEPDEEGDEEPTVEAMFPAVAETEPPEPTPAPEPPVREPVAVSPNRERYRLITVPAATAPPAGDHQEHRLPQPVWIVPDERGVALAMLMPLQSKGYQVVLSAKAPPTPPGTVIFLPGLNAFESAFEALEVNRRAVEIAHALAATPPARWLSAQDTGGDFGLGRSDPVRLWTSGLSGLARQLSLEWPLCRVQALDVDQGGRSLDAITSQLLDALVRPREEICLGLLPNRQEVALGLEAAPLPGWVGSALSERYPSGMTLLVSGLPTDGTFGDCLVALARSLQPRLLLLTRRELHPAQGDVIRRLEEVGADVRDRVWDGTDRNALLSLLAATRNEWGPIQGLLHPCRSREELRLGELSPARLDATLADRPVRLLAMLDALALDPLEIISVCLPGDALSVDDATADEVLANAARFLAQQRPNALVRLVAAPSPDTFLGELASPDCPQSLSGAPPAVLRRDLLLSPRCQPWLAHHRARTNPTVPLVQALEWLLQAAHFAGLDVLGVPLDDVVVRKPLRLPHDPLPLTTVCEQTEEGGYLLAVIGPRSVIHYSANLRPDPVLPKPAEGEPPPWGKSLENPYERGERGLFQGPSYRVIDGAPLVWDTGAEASLLPARCPAGVGMIDSMLIDGGLQLAWLWSDLLFAQPSTPSRIERCVFHQLGPIEGPVRCTLIRESHSHYGTVAEALFHDVHGLPVAELTGIEMTFGVEARGVVPRSPS